MSRVLHLIETGGPGGAENLLLSLAHEYQQRGVSQIIGLRKDTWLASKVREMGVDLWIHPLNKRIDFGWIRSAKRLVKDSGATVIHAHEFTMTLHGSILAYLTGVRCVATIHGRSYYSQKAIRRALFRFCSLRCRFVGVSNDICGLLINEVGIKPHRVELIHNGIDIDRYGSGRNEIKRSEFRRSLGIEPSSVLIGCVGSLYEVKGHIFLIDAIAKLAHEQRLPAGLAVVIVGRGGLEEQLLARIERLGLSNTIRLLGFRDDVPQLLQALDLFALPSLSEGLPLCLLEAGAAGVPIVASSVGGVPDYLKDGALGWLCKPGDVDALANAISDALSDDAQDRAELLRNEVLKNYSLKSMASKYLELYV